jgi:peptide subunit release factor 1 (eRF1)
MLQRAQEKRLISKFFEEISQDTGKYVFGVKVGVAECSMIAVRFHSRLRVTD